MKNLRSSTLNLFLSVFFVTGYCQTEIFDGVEFEMPKVIEPEFLNYSVSILDFGAVADGLTLNTEAFKEAIDHVALKGGGRVVVPRGVWLTGPIVLKSNINLHTEAGALVLFSTNKDLYPLIHSYYEGREDVRCQSPISGRDIENIAFTGKGIFDGNGQVWRHVKREKLTPNQWKDLINSGGVTNANETVWYTSQGQMKAYQLRDKGELINYRSIEDCRPMRDFFRPVMISLINCKNILFDGPTFQNSPNWNIHPLMCENLTVRNTNIRNPWFSQNGDGIDIESSKNVLVYDNNFDVGDDAICIKSGKDKSGRERGIPSENIIIKNNIVYSGHGGVVVGSEMSGDVRNVHISDCTFIGTEAGIRFKSRRGRGGVVEKIYITNIDMIDILTNAISFNLYYQGKSMVEMIADNDHEKVEKIAVPVTEKTPIFRDISIKNINCKGAFQAIYVRGLPEMKIEDLLLENLNMTADNGLTCIDVSGLTIIDLKLNAINPRAAQFFNVENATIKGLNLINQPDGAIVVGGSQSNNIEIELTESKKNQNILIVQDDLMSNEIVLKH